MTTITGFREAVKSALGPLSSINTVLVHDDGKFSDADIKRYSIGGNVAAIVCFVGLDGLTPWTKKTFNAPLDMAVVVLAKGVDRSVLAYDAAMEIAACINDNSFGQIRYTAQSAIAIVPYSDDRLVKQGISMVGVTWTQTVALSASGAINKGDSTIEPIGPPNEGYRGIVNNETPEDFNDDGLRFSSQKPSTN